jgi:1-acyl-sn-glycerol-3-phosphate acyltransferase
MLYSILSTLCFVLSKILFRLEVRGIENFPMKGGIIIVSNHVSLLDPIIIGAVCSMRSKRINFMAKAELFRNKVFAAFIRRLHVFPVNRNQRDIGAIREAIKRLKQGKALLMFPEGRRSKNGELLDVRSGVGLLAKRAHVPILPAFIKGTSSALPKGSWFIRPMKVAVYFGEPYYIDGTVSHLEIATNVMKKVRSLDKNVNFKKL